MFVIYFIQNQSMSYGRTIEPQLLSIQAIIQKSQFKSKILNRIPTDIKKLFIEQATKPTKINQHKKPPLIYQGIYSQTIDHNDESTKYKKSIPPILTRQIKSQSLNSSSSNMIKPGPNKNQQLVKRNIHTTRTYANSRESQRRRMAQRKSMEETSSMEKNNLNAFNIQNQNIASNLDGPLPGAQVKIENEKQTTNQKFHNFQYELVLPQKDKKQRGFRKVYISKQRNQQKFSNHDTNGNSNTIQNEETDACIKTEHNQQDSENETLQHKMSHDMIPQPTKVQKQRQNSQKNSLIQKKTDLNVIPDFVIAAIGDQNKKVSTTKSINAQLPTFLQLNIEPTIESKQRILKPPTCVAAMKKKISYNKNLRAEEPYEQIMEPKANLIKLVEKEGIISFTRKNSEVLTQQRKKVKSRERIPSFERMQTKKHRIPINIEQDVKGWDIKESHQFYDQY